MAYRRFRSPENAFGSATLATIATVQFQSPGSVATVATVARQTGQKRGKTAASVATAATVASPHPIFRGSECEQHIPLPDFSERAAILEYDGGMPRPWAEAMARLECERYPARFSERDWQRAVDDAGRFLDCWRDRAERLGWQPAEILASEGGLIWFIEGGSVEGVTPHYLLVRHSQDQPEKIYRRCVGRPMP